MTTSSFALFALSLAMPLAAQAQERDANRLQGAHVGIDATRDSTEANPPTSSREATRKGFGARAHLGYDAVLGNIVLLGAEVGVGKGGKTVTQASLVTPGRYQVNPGLTYDATARLGIAPSNGFALYGRAGYRWLKTEVSVTGQPTGNLTRKRTEKGLTYGGGVEFAATQNFSIRAEYGRTKFSKDLRQSKISLGASIRF